MNRIKLMIAGFALGLVAACSVGELDDGGEDRIPPPDAIVNEVAYEACWYTCYCHQGGNSGICVGNGEGQSGECLDRASAACCEAIACVFSGY